MTEEEEEVLKRYSTPGLRRKHIEPPLFALIKASKANDAPTSEPAAAAATTYDVPQSDESTSLALRAAVKTAAKAVGGKNKLACMLGISGPAVYMWKQIPTKRVLEIERLTNVRREILRPDLYQTPTLEVLETGEAEDMSP